MTTQGTAPSGVPSSSVPSSWQVTFVAAACGRAWVSRKGDVGVHSDACRRGEPDGACRGPADQVHAPSGVMSRLANLLGLSLDETAEWLDQPCYYLDGVRPADLLLIDRQAVYDVAASEAYDRGCPPPLFIPRARVVDVETGGLL